MSAVHRNIELLFQNKPDTPFVCSRSSLGAVALIHARWDVKWRDGDRQHLFSFTCTLVSIQMDTWDPRSARLDEPSTPSPLSCFVGGQVVGGGIDHHSSRTEEQLPSSVCYIIDTKLHANIILSPSLLLASTDS